VPAVTLGSKWWYRLPAATAVVLGSLYVVWMAAAGVPGDYATEFATPMKALLGGHFGAFAALLPTEGAGGSVALRAPAALLAKLFGAGPMASFRFGALECVLAAGALGLWLARDRARAGRAAIGGVIVTALCVLSPGILGAILFGHPEEVLGAALCVAAVLLAGERHPALAGIALGLATINKPWALFAVAPVLIAAPGRTRRMTVAGVAAAVVGAWLVATFALAPAHFSQQLTSALAVVAHPVDVWWPLAHPAVTPGGMHVYLAPTFLARHGRELALLVTIPLALPLARRRRVSVDACLALLALLFLLRCMLDPSNHVYYQVPFVIALIAWDARTGAVPVLALLATILLWLVFHTVSGIAREHIQFVAYMAATLPFVAVLARSAYGDGRRTAALGAPARAPAPAPESAWQAAGQ
jgi:hypothetical protein